MATRDPRILEEVAAALQRHGTKGPNGLFSYLREMVDRHRSGDLTARELASALGTMVDILDGGGPGVVLDGKPWRQ